MDNKSTAIVLDTNFVIAYSDLQNIVEQLSHTTDVYISQITIDERHSQRYLETKTIYDKLESVTTEYRRYADIKIKEEFEVYFEKLCASLNNSYQIVFGDRVLPLRPTAELLTEVVDRAYKKIPPFSTAKNSSDKGFKDTLIWFSMLEYFKSTAK